MVDLTPPAGVDTSLTVYDHNQRVQAGNILYDLLHQNRTSILECPGFLEATALATFLTPLAPDPNTSVRHCAHVRHVPVSLDSAAHENAGTTVIDLNQDLVATWSRIKTGNFFWNTKQVNNYYLLKLAIHLTIVQEYMRAIMFQFAIPAGTPEYIRGQKVEAGYWVEGWLSQSGPAYFLYDRQPLGFDQMCATLHESET